MKRTLAITAATAMLALSLAGCGAQRDGDMDLLPDFDGGGTGATTATDTMRNDGGTAGTGTTDGASVNNGTAATNGTGLNGVTGAVNRGTTGYGTATTDGTMQNGSARYGTTSGAYTATNNGGLTATNNGRTTNNSMAANNSVNYADAAAVRRAAIAGDRYARMLQNARVHDSDGFLFDGENTSYRTY